MNQVLHKLINKIVEGMRIPVPKNCKIVYSSHYLAQKVALCDNQSLVAYWLAVLQMSEFLPENHKLTLLSCSTEAGRIKGRNKVRFIVLSTYYQFCQILSNFTERLKFRTTLYLL